MRAIVPGLFGLGLAVAACGTPAGRCDPQALHAAADAVDAMLVAWRPDSGVPPQYRLAVDGLRSACSSLPTGFHKLEGDVHPYAFKRNSPLEEPGLWKDPAAIGPLLAHCPKGQDVLEQLRDVRPEQRTQLFYNQCGLAGLGVFTLAELPATIPYQNVIAGHALHLWLVADGATPELARALVRPIVVGTDRTFAGVLPWTRLPTAAYGPPSTRTERILHASLAEVTHDQTGLLVALSRGRLPADLDHEAMKTEAVRQLAPAADHDRESDTATAISLVLDADPQLPWATVEWLVAVAIKAGFTRIEARALGQHPLHPVVQLPLYSIAGHGTVASVELDAEGVSLTCAGSLRSTREAEFRGCGDRFHLAVDADLSWQQVVDVLVRLDGVAPISGVATLRRP